MPDQNIDTTTPAGHLTFHLLGAIAEFERNLISERRNEGIERAREKGIRFGRKPKSIPTQLKLSSCALKSLRPLNLAVSSNKKTRWKIAFEARE
ncbi:MAG: recombinase family protein [Alphaproteobacteria bacterium]|nr:recombinase family protein [Alphaproteobacteria bacterium]